MWRPICISYIYVFLQGLIATLVGGTIQLGEKVTTHFPSVALEASNQQFLTRELKFKKK